MDEQKDQTAAAIPQAPAPEPATPAAPVKKEIKEGLRTYAGDFGTSISGERGDIIRRAIQEEERKAEAAKSQTLASRQNLLFLGGSILAIVIGIIAIVYLAVGTRTQTIEPVKNQVPSIVFADTSKEISLDGLKKEELVASSKSEISAKLAAGTIKNIFFTETRANVKYLAGAKSLLSILASNAPELLTDGLGNTFMFGVYNAAGTNAPFLIFKTDMYNDAFSGMRAWESRLFDDLYQLFAISTSGDNSNLFEAKFDDAVLKNKDARVLRNSASQTVLLYAFVDERTIVITTDPLALEEVAKRLSAQKVEQAQ